MKVSAQTGLLSKAIVALFLCSFTPETWAGSFAEFSYKLLNGECPKSQDQPVLIDKNCTTAETQEKRTALLLRDFGQISEDAFFASLADERGNALSCARDQVASLLSNPDDKKHFAEDTTAKLILLLNEKKTMDGLRPAIGHDRPNAEGAQPGTAAYDYKKSRLRAEAILASIPFSQTTGMRNLINMISSQDDFIISGDLVEGVQKYINESAQKALPAIEKELGEGADAMRQAVASSGRSLNDKTRESLAQDTDLIESFRQKNPQLESTLRSTACRVDSKYGKGAQYRDTAVTAALILGTGAASGVLRAGAAELIANVTGAAARGAIPFRAAGVLRVTAAAMESAVPLDQIYNACFNSSSSVRGKAVSVTCERSVLTSLQNENCALNASLSLLGVGAISSATKEALALLRAPVGVGPAAKILESPGAEG